MKMKIPNEVRKAINTQTKIQAQKRKETVFQLAKKHLEANEAVAVGFWGENYRVEGEDFFDDKFNRHIKVIPVISQYKDKEEKTVRRRTGFYVAFDVNSIELNSAVELKVPKSQAGIFIGTRACHLKEWCQKLGLKKIEVVVI